MEGTQEAFGEHTSIPQEVQIELGRDRSSDFYESGTKGEMWLPKLVKLGMSGYVTMSPSGCVALCKLFILPSLSFPMWEMGIIIVITS